MPFSKGSGHVDVSGAFKQTTVSGTMILRYNYMKICGAHP